MNATAQTVKNVASGELIKSIEFNLQPITQFEKELQEFKKRYIDTVYDLTDPDQEKQARSDRLTISKVIKKLDNAHAEVKKPFKEKVDLIDDARKTLKDQFIEVQDSVKNQLKVHEEKIAEHVQMLQDRVDAIYDFTDYEGTPKSLHVKELIEELNALEIDDSYEHRKADAALAKMETLKELNKLYDELVTREKEAEELEKLRVEKEERDRKDREDQIAKDAAENARIEAENKAARELADREEEAATKQRAAAKAAQDKIDEANRLAMEAEEKAAKAVEYERKRAAKQKEEDEAIKAAELKKEADRKAKVAYRNRIKKEAMASLVLLGLSTDTTEIVFDAISNGEIKHIEVNY